MMGVCTCLLFFLLYTQITYCEGAGVRNSTSYTLHTTPRTWNEAVNVCSKAGENLVYPAWEEKYLDFKHIVDYWASDGEAVDALWIGMYDYNPPAFNFTWIDCCEIDSTFDLWGSLEPNNEATEHCVRIVNGAEWKTKACNVQYPFVCELEKGGCIFEMLPESGLRNNLVLETAGMMSLAECKSYCLYLHTPECLAITHDTGTCIVHRGERIYITTLPLTTSKSDAVTGVKRCHSYNIIRNSSTTAEPAADPLHSCNVHQSCFSRELMVTSPPILSLSTTNAITETSALSFNVIDITTASASMTMMPLSDSLTMTTLPATPTPLSDSSTIMPEILDFSESISILFDTKFTLDPDAFTELMSSSLPLSEDFTTASPYLPTTYFEISKTISESQYNMQTSNTLEASSQDLEFYSNHMSTSASGAQILTSATTTMGGYNQEVTEQCRCACFPKEDKPDKIRAYLKRLVLERRELSRYKRLVSSAADERLSAQCIGWSFGIGILAFVGCFIVFLDLNYVVKFFWDKNYRRQS